MNEITNPYLWRQRREDLMWEAERDRPAGALRAERKTYTFSPAWELLRMAGLLLTFLRRLESGEGGRP